MEMKKLTIFLMICCGLSVFFSALSTFGLLNLYNYTQEEIGKLKADLDGVTNGMRRQSALPGTDGSELRTL